MEGLARLEYRGYDSAGIAVAGGTIPEGRPDAGQPNPLQLRRAPGKLRNLDAILRDRPRPRHLRHRPHPLGHPRPPHRRKRPPPPRRHRHPRRRAQRHRRKLPPAQAGPHRQGPQIRSPKPTPKSSPTSSRTNSNPPRKLRAEGLRRGGALVPPFRPCREKGLQPRRELQPQMPSTATNRRLSSPRPPTHPPRRSRPPRRPAASPAPSPSASSPPTSPTS